MFQSFKFLGPCSLTLFLLSFSVPAFAGYGTFSFTKRSVSFVSDDGSTKRARRGARVEQGDRIRTGADSYAKITMSDKNLIHIGPDSEVVLQKYTTKEEGEAESILNVVYGKVRTALEEQYDGETSRFRVITSAAIMGVRGTDFLTEHSSEAQQTRTTAFEGLLSIQGIDEDGQPTQAQELMAGQMTLITGGSPPLEPIELPDAVIESINSGSKEASAKKSFKKEASAELNSAVKQDFSVSNLPDFARAKPEPPGENFIERNTVNSLSKDAGGDASVEFDIVDGTI